MNIDESPVPATSLQSRLDLLQAANLGQLEALICPGCGKATVSVSFVKQAGNDYWTWFTCSECAFEMRAQGECPPFYSADRERASQPQASQ